MKLDNLFSYRPEANISRNVHIKKADTIGSTKSIEHYDRFVSDAIKDYKEAIEVLEEYRRTLYERYQAICSTPFKYVLRLNRVINYSGSKSYIITVVKRFDGNNIDDEEIKRESFEGKERHKALKRFEALQKEYPNIATEIDIDKKHWER